MPIFNFNQNGQVVIPLPVPIENGGTGAEDAATARTNLGLGSGALLDITLPLSVANGGTGSDTQNFVDLTTIQNIGGIKTFTSATASTSTTTGALKVSAGGVGVVGNIYAGSIISATTQFNIGTVKVLGARQTGWVAPTGTATKTTFLTSTVTLPQLAERVKALIDALISHGLIG